MSGPPPAAAAITHQGRCRNSPFEGVPRCTAKPGLVATSAAYILTLLVLGFYAVATSRGVDPRFWGSSVFLGLEVVHVMRTVWTPVFPTGACGGRGPAASSDAAALWYTLELVASMCLYFVAYFGTPVKWMPAAFGGASYVFVFGNVIMSAQASIAFPFARKPFLILFIAAIIMFLMNITLHFFEGEPTDYEHLHEWTLVSYSLVALLVHVPTMLFFTKRSYDYGLGPSLVDPDADVPLIDER